MSVYQRIFSAAADTSISISNTVYLTARASSFNTSGGATASTGSVANSFSTPNYIVAQSFLVFDTSAVPAGSGTASVSVSVNVFGGNAGGETVRLREVSSVGFKIPGASLAAQTLLSNPGTFPTGTGRFALPISDLSLVTRSTTFRTVLHTVGEENATVPTGVSSFVPYLSEITGTTNDPYLDTVGGWSLVGVGTVSAAATATPLTLTEPAGVADGDLLIACIASRSTATTAVTSTGWTAVGSQNNNNTLATTSAIGSGTMLYRIRSGAPTLAFTLPATVDVAIGRIIAYRGSAQAAPLDASTAVTTATNTLAVSVTGLTTTQDDDLIVAMIAGGQEAAWSAFSNVTTPLTASGATDTTSAPATGAWIERADSNTTTGSDTSLAIFDAIRTGTGATGNLTATASLGAGHVVIAGAFKIAAAAAAAVTGTGSVTLSASAAASGIEGVAGTAAATVNASASASGTHAVPVTGTAAATLAASSSASGVEGVKGAAIAPITLSGAATGAHGVSGTAAATLALSASAIGAFYGATTGTAAATLALSASATGEFEEASAATGLISVWTGSAWVDKPMMVWTGSAWVQKPVMSWDGSSWV